MQVLQEGHLVLDPVVEGCSPFRSFESLAAGQISPYSHKTQSVYQIPFHILGCLWTL
jgi:hypothetical protein